MSSGTHIHLIDGKQISYDNATCPICRPEAPPEPAPTLLPRCYRKGNTIVTQVSKGLMSTTTWWTKENMLLHSVRRIQRDGQGNVLRGADNMPLWQQLTMRISIAIAKEYITELSKLVSDMEKQTPAKPSNVPQRG